MTAPMVPQGNPDQIVLVGAPADGLPAQGPGSAPYNRRLIATGLAMDLFLLTGSLYLLLRTRRAKLPAKNPFAWARSFVHALEYLYFLDAAFSTTRRVFALWGAAAAAAAAGAQPGATTATALMGWARLHVEALGSGALLGGVHAGLALFVGEWQARLPPPRTAWWCEPFYYFAKFLGWQLAGALAALRVAAVLAASRLPALACLYYRHAACGAGSSQDGPYGEALGRDAAAVDDKLKILVFYIGLLLLSPFWYKGGPWLWGNMATTVPWAAYRLTRAAEDRGPDDETARRWISLLTDILFARLPTLLVLGMFAAHLDVRRRG